MEEGLSQYYGRGARGRDRALAIWGFSRHKDLYEYLNDKETFTAKAQFRYGAALSRRLVEWMWHEHPAAEIPVMQKLLQGTPLDRALIGEGLNGNKFLVQRFDEAARPNHRWYSLLFTLDLWLIVLGLAAWIAMVLMVVRAWREARLEITEEGPATEPVIEAELLQGPALGGAAEAPPAPKPPLDRAPAQAAGRPQPPPVAPRKPPPPARPVKVAMSEDGEVIIFDDEAPPAPSTPPRQTRREPPRPPGLPRLPHERESRVPLPPLPRDQAHGRRSAPPTPVREQPAARQTAEADPVTPATRPRPGGSRPTPPSLPPRPPRKNRPAPPVPPARKSPLPEDPEVAQPRADDDLDNELDNIFDNWGGNSP